MLPGARRPSRRSWGTRRVKPRSPSSEYLAPVRDLAAIYRGLAAFHRAGAGWGEALASVADHDPAWARARTAVASGRALSEALAPLVPGLDLALVRAGETSGRLEQALEDLAE